MDLRQLLEAVASGRRGFQPTEGGLDAFQSVAELIIEAGDSGYLEGVNPHKESHTGRRLYAVVMVKGLTEAGKDFLAES